MTRSRARIVAALALWAAGLVPAAVRAQPASPDVAEASAPQVTLKVSGKTLTYTHPAPDGKGLEVKIQGPATFVVHFRALSFGTARGIVEIERLGVSSLNRYELERDFGHDLSTSGLTEEGALFVTAPAGPQTYFVRTASGPPLVMRFQKSRTVNERYRAAPEGRPLPPLDARRSGYSVMIAEAGGRAAAPQPSPAAPPDATPRADVPASPTEGIAASMPGNAPPDAEAAPAPVPDLFSMKTEAEMVKPPTHRTGFFAGNRVGLHLPFSERFVVDEDSTPLLQGTLELGWDLSTAGSLYVEGEFLQIRGKDSGAELVRLWGGSAGYLWPGTPVDEGGPRLRLGVAGARQDMWADGNEALSPVSTRLLGGLLGFGYEGKFGPVRLGLELRWVQFMNLDGPGARRGLSFLVGYRVAL